MRYTPPAAALSWGIVTLPALAQFETATVLGTVRDPSGAVVTAAKVTLENVQTGIAASALTSEAGDYQFLNVRVGTYRVQAEAAGFKTAVAAPFAVAVNARQRVDLTLEVGATTESITITGAAAAALEPTAVPAAPSSARNRWSISR